MKAILNQEITKTFDELFSTLAKVTPAQVDMIAFEGSWTVGQCTEHIIKSMSGMPGICNGKTVSTTRMPDEKLPAIKNVFLDFNLKMKSPDFLIPVEATHDLNTLKTELETIRSHMMEISNTHDLGLICKAFEVPGFGPFTRYELISFALIHAQRHTHQLKNIIRQLDA